MDARAFFWRKVCTETMGFDLSHFLPDGEERVQTGGFVLRSASNDFCDEQPSGFDLDGFDKEPTSSSGRASSAQVQASPGFQLGWETQADFMMEDRAQKVVHIPLKKEWYDLIATGQKDVEVRSRSQHWISRLTGATHVSFSCGYVAGSQLPAMKILSVQYCSAHGHDCPTWLPKFGSPEYTQLFGKNADLVVIRFEQHRETISARNSMMPNLARAFQWAAKFWNALTTAVGGLPNLQWSLLGRPIKISSHCSGIGGAEVSAQMLVASSLDALGFPVNIDCESTCDTSKRCRSMLLDRARAAGKDWHVFDDIFSFFPGWNQEIEDPETMIQKLKETCQPTLGRHCHQHGSACSLPEVDGDLCGSPCPPCSRCGSHLGALLAIFSSLFLLIF